MEIYWTGLPRLDLEMLHETCPYKEMLYVSGLFIDCYESSYYMEVSIGS
jgi:hypothetical protein